MTTTKHTPGPWKVMADPNHGGFHEFHANRWVATADAEVERSPSNDADWALREGRLICCVRDGSTAENARLIAAAPDLLEALRLAHECLMDPSRAGHPDGYGQSTTGQAIRAAIRKAEGATR